jgi:hypothetical protein
MTIANPTDVVHTVNLVTQVLCMPITSAFVALRWYTRIRFKQSIGVEDCMFWIPDLPRSFELIGGFFLQMRALWLGYVPCFDPDRTLY